MIPQPIGVFRDRDHVGLRVTAKCRAAPSHGRHRGNYGVGWEDEEDSKTWKTTLSRSQIKNESMPRHDRFFVVTTGPRSLPRLQIFLVFPAHPVVPFVSVTPR